MGLTYVLEEVDERDIAILRVQGELDFNDRGEFQNATDFLLQSKKSRYVIDLSKITRISSVFIGTLVDVGVKVRDAEKTISVMMAKRMAKVCREAGLEPTIQILDVKE